MTISLGPASPFPYSVYVLAAGAWGLATADTSALSLDALLARRQSPRRVSLAADSLRGRRLFRAPGRREPFPVVVGSWFAAISQMRRLLRECSRKRGAKLQFALA